MSFKFGAFSGSSSAGATSSSSVAGGGLYAGISLGGSTPVKGTVEDPDSTPIPGPQDPDPLLHSHSASTNGQPTQPSTSDLPVSGESKKDDDKSKASSWSSSLRFAPVIRKQPAKSTSKPFALPFSSNASAKSGLAAITFAPDDEPETAPSNTAARAMHIPGRAKAALNASTPAARTSKPPSVFARKGGFLAAHAPERIPGGSNVSDPSVAASNTLAAAEKVDSSIPGFKHSLPAMLSQTTTLKGLVPSHSGAPNKILKKKLEQPPPLTLPEDELGTPAGGDVNGFAHSEAGRKLALRAARNSKKSKKKGKTREVDPAILFMEDYDPARPNDYNEWMNFVKRRRELRREAQRLERQRQQRLERDEMSESSYYSSDDDGNASDEGTAAPRGNFFAPPPEYHESTAKNDAPEPPESAQVPSMARAETGDEAYARRVALSQGIPYQPPHHAPATQADVPDDFTDSPTTTEAPSATLPAPVVSIADAQARAKIIAERLQKLKESGNESSGAPPAPGMSIPEASTAVATLPNPSTTLLEAQAKAKLVAAKLAALNAAKPSLPVPTDASEVSQHPIQETNPPAPAPTVSKAPGQPDFARRLMDKYGWKEGQGLGATESGRTSILTVAAATSAHGGNKKRKENPGDIGAAGPMGPNKTTVMSKGRGVVIDDSKTQRDLAEKTRYGEPTRIVYLTNVVAVDEVDDGLATEIAEEAGKHGIVERCFVRIIQRSDIDDPSEQVRVFILYSGLVGAWKAVKTFDGRFFGGRNIRARFFSENSFTLGDWDA